MCKTVINKTSWHYRYLIYSGICPIADWCPYWRQVVGTIIMHIFTAFIVTIALFWLSYPVLQIFFGSDVIFACLSGMFWIGVGVIAQDHFKQYTYNKTFLLKPKEWKEPEEPKDPGLISMWLKAKHDKICPRIEFK